MKLQAAFRLPDLPRLAMIGAGGKSSALFCLAKELEEQQRTVIISTTTHLGAWQVKAGDAHLMLGTDEWLDTTAGLPKGVVFITGPIGDDQRASGLDERTMGQLCALADTQQLPLLIEADGARQLPLKAPAEHEPVVPEWVNQVGVCAGLMGSGKPLSGDWVHRPERFAHLSGLKMGELITPEALSRVLMHPQGGLKGIPTHARRFLLLNQADTQELQAHARTMTRLVQQAYHSVVIASSPGKGGEGKPGSLGQGFEIHAVHEAVAGIILAAGGAMRYGSLKQLLPWKGQPLVRHVAQTALQAGLSPVVLVTGAGAEEVSQAISGLPVRLVHNPDWQAGQSTSVQAGLRVLPEMCGGAVFLLADQPHIPATLVDALVEAHSQELAPIVAPLVDGQRGNPVLFDAVTFKDLLTLTGDQGGRQVFSRYPVRFIHWHDRAVLLDVDVPQDYERLIRGE